MKKIISVLTEKLIPKFGLSFLMLSMVVVVGLSRPYGTEIIWDWKSITSVILIIITVIVTIFMGRDWWRHRKK
jgi:hypothetical protein